MANLNFREMFKLEKVDLVFYKFLDMMDFDLSPENLAHQYVANFMQLLEGRDGDEEDLENDDDEIREIKTYYKQYEELIIFIHNYIRRSNDNENILYLLSLAFTISSQEKYYDFDEAAYSLYNDDFFIEKENIESFIKEYKPILDYVAKGNHFEGAFA